MAQWLMNPTRNRQDVGLIPVLAQCVKDMALLCALGFSGGWDLRGSVPQARKSSQRTRQMLSRLLMP